jgi:exodeoxyribonuclease VII large subunit
MKIIARGEITVYEKGGYYQLNTAELQPAGVGELQIAFEKLKQKLFEEGLFDESHKKTLPEFPEKIGIVTSPTGAAIKDLVSILRRRFPAIQIIIRPTKVQGEGAAQDIVNAINEFNKYGDVDVLIVGRGGGSIEDLWAFNEEIVARAIYNSKIPVISAVGHEVDFTISDLVADKRASTPSNAAEITVRDKNELIPTISALRRGLNFNILSKIEYYKEKLDTLINSYAFRKPLDIIKQYYQRIDEITKRIENSIFHKFEITKNEVVYLEKRLQSLDPQSILKRGYSICYFDGKIIKDSSELKTGDNVKIKFFKGEVLSKVFSKQKSIKQIQQENLEFMEK